MGVPAIMSTVIAPTASALSIPRIPAARTDTDDTISLRTRSG